MYYHTRGLGSVLVNTGEPVPAAVDVPGRLVPYRTESYRLTVPLVLHRTEARSEGGPALGPATLPSPFLI